MKNLTYRTFLVAMALAGLGLASCGPELTTDTATIELSLSGEMLFEGANTLQYSGANQLTEVARAVGADEASVRAVSVSSVVVELDDATRQIVESLLLQIVSDNMDLVTIGTLSPLPEGNVLALSIAEDPAILPYLKDTGTTWVLDMNINEDHMDALGVNAQLKLAVETIPNKN